MVPQEASYRHHARVACLLNLLHRFHKTITEAPKLWGNKNDISADSDFHPRIFQTKNMLPSTKIELLPDFWDIEPINPLQPNLMACKDSGALNVTDTVTGQEVGLVGWVGGGDGGILLRKATKHSFSSCSVRLLFDWHNRILALVPLVLFHKTKCKHIKG